MRRAPTEEEALGSEAAWKKAPETAVEIPPQASPPNNAAEDGNLFLKKTTKMELREDIPIVGSAWSTREEIKPTCTHPTPAPHQPDQGQHLSMWRTENRRQRTQEQNFGSFCLVSLGLLSKI